ncbi:FIST signal transduction protein [Dinoroseobacter sp. S76]|uniref:FIST signal transduction protein n=1 Tax=Dinoroseobacter sp. S76 TaxID=3415124 RepID=UPI003C7D82EF
MKIRVLSIAADAEAGAVQELHGASFIAVHGNCATDPRALGLVECAGQVHGATSCLGAMSHEGVTDGLAIFAIDDPDGAYGTAMLPFDPDSYSAARAATMQALAAADRLGEKPELVWVSSTPGTEEAILAGIESVIGTDVPIIGGSAADNDVAGNWFVFDKSRSEAAGVVVTVMFPSRPVSFAYHNGYSPTEKSGTATKIEGRRVLEIDHRPAFEVYGEWCEGAVALDPAKTGPQSILSDSTLSPLGRKVTELDGLPSYLLAHPAAAETTGALELFATVEKGEVLTFMTGTQAGLIDRAGRVAALARAAGSMETAPIAGALMVYCGGCMLSVRDRLDEVVAGVADSLGPAPFLGTFTFGEQGQIIGAGNRHGNLMISCIVFG